MMAQLSAFIEPAALACDIQLKLHFLSPTSYQYKDDVFHLYTDGSKQSLRQVPWRASNKQEVTWDITAAIADLKTHLNQVAYPVIMTVECTGMTAVTMWNVPPVKEILIADRQAVIELLTAKTLQVKMSYNRRRLSSRSVSAQSRRSNLCPSFMDGERHLAMCCLFEYTLSKQQMDANPKLRFIIFPQHLPLNLCHGRCVGKSNRRILQTTSVIRFPG